MSRLSKSHVVAHEGKKTTVSLGTFHATIYQLVEPGRPTRYRTTWFTQGGRNTRTSKTLPEAIELAKGLLDLRNQGRDDVASIPAEKLRYYQECEAALSVPLDVAVRYYITQVGGRCAPLLLSDLADRVVAGLSARGGVRGASDAWVQTVRVHATRFVNAFSDRSIHEIKPDDLRDFLACPTWGMRTRFNHQQIISMLFAAAKEDGALPEGKTAYDLMKPKYVMPDEEEKEVLAPGDLGKIFQACLSSGREDFIPHVAVGAFAGVRIAEGCRLRWGKHVDLEEKVIRLTSDITKTSRRRLVPISEVLMEWLLLAPNRREGELIQPYATSSEIFTKLWRDVAKLPAWPRNALRVSFVSYAMAKTENAASVANMAGHSEAMLQTVYKQIRGVSKKTAEEWFNIRPCQFSVS